MQNKIYILFLVLIWGCGNTMVDERKLESFSNITNAGTVTLDKSGSLLRGNGTTKDVIIYNGQSYKISMYSSYSALEFVSAKPLNYQANVQFKGDIRGFEIILVSVKPL